MVDYHSLLERVSPGNVEVCILCVHCMIKCCPNVQCLDHNTPKMFI